MNCEYKGCDDEATFFCEPSSHLATRDKLALCHDHARELLDLMHGGRTIGEALFFYKCGLISGEIASQYGVSD